MAKETITHRCGHDQTYQLYGPHKEREKKLAWLESTDCTDCYYKAKDAAREAQNKAAAEVAGLKGLPALTGSEKQIAWAETIRVGILDKFEKAEAEVLDEVKEINEPSPEALAEVEDALALLSTELLGQAEARWWIDNRGDGWSDSIGSFRWILKQMYDRGLTPTMVAEVAAKKEAAKAAERDRQAAYAAMVARANAVAAEIRVDTSTVAVDGRTVTVTDGDRVLRYHPYIWEARDSQGDCGRPDLTPNRRNQVFGVAIQVVANSLVGVTVVAAVATKKRSENLTVTLSDGRELRGHHTKQQTDFFGLFDWVLPADHPEVIRLVSEVRKVVTRG